jgi:hypothetical protein
MGIKERLAARGNGESAPAFVENINLKAARETVLEVTLPGGGESVPVDFCEYESVPEGDFVRVLAADHSLGVAAEYAWFRNKYPGAIRESQYFRFITLNGTRIRCDILTLRLGGGEQRNVYFDISAMMPDLDRKVREEY